MLHQLNVSGFACGWGLQLHLVSLVMTLFSDGVCVYNMNLLRDSVSIQQLCSFLIKDSESSKDHPSPCACD